MTSPALEEGRLQDWPCYPRREGPDGVERPGQPSLSLTPPAVGRREGGWPGGQGGLQEPDRWPGEGTCHGHTDTSSSSLLRESGTWASKPVSGSPCHRPLFSQPPAATSAATLLW